MKMIIAVLRPHVLDDARDKLEELGVPGFTVTEVRGYGRQKGHTELYRGAEYQVEFVSKIKIEIAVNDDIADSAIEAISELAKTGKPGDGKIFVLELADALRVRTGEQGPEAL